MAKDPNPDTIPSNLTLGGVEVNPRGVAGAFAGHFNEKIRLNVSRTKVDVRGITLVNGHEPVSCETLKLCESSL